ncbi:NBR1-Ig-like domain-containing protein [Nonomuraea sp. NPDC050663]|uniref:NBR1-Ig-like domain-containing protein n=1 Tax=Nonomuraea sp. NPDC050663 TaxID=3364370 RepID=UPI00378BDA5C
MSGRSGAISHTTLHEATKGNRLPSWETTVEFVKACGADPAHYRERWEAASLAVRSTGVTEERPVVEAPAQPVGKRFQPSKPIMIAAGIGAFGAAALIALLTGLGGEPEARGHAPAITASVAALTPADCPVRSSNPPAAAPLHKGDAAMFIKDVTLPDCTRVGQGETMTKVWQLKNAGTVLWKGYSLRRLDVAQQGADQCQTISDVPIPDTPPGETVDIRTDVTTPRKPGLCYVRFKMVDASGALVFPGNRPINFQLIVGG